MLWEAGCLRGEEVSGKNEGADQKLRGWWDARWGSSCVTALHKGLHSAVSPACATRGREMSGIQTMHSSSIHAKQNSQSRLLAFSAFIMCPFIFTY